VHGGVAVPAEGEPLALPLAGTLVAVGRFRTTTGTRFR
jgi:hypothetical protein